MFLASSLPHYLFNKLPSRSFILTILFFTNPPPHPAPSYLVLLLDHNSISPSLSHTHSPYFLFSFPLFSITTLTSPTCLNFSPLPVLISPHTFFLLAHQTDSSLCGIVLLSDAVHGISSILEYNQSIIRNLLRKRFRLCFTKTIKKNHFPKAFFKYPPCLFAFVLPLFVNVLILLTSQPWRLGKKNICKQKILVSSLYLNRRKLCMYV